MRRPLKDLRRFVLVDTERNVNQAAVDNESQQNTEPDDKVVISGKPDPEELKTTTFSQR